MDAANIAPGPEPQPVSPVGRHGVDHPRQFATVAGSVLFSQLSYFLTFSALSLYLKGIGVPAARIGFDVGVGSVASLVASLVAGPLLDRKGTKFFLMLGSSLYMLAGLMMLSVSLEPVVVSARVLLGVGLAVIGPSASAAVPWLAPRRIGSAVGVMSTISSLPLAIGPAVGLSLYTTGGPLWLFIPSICLAAIGFGFALRLHMPARPVQVARTSRFGYDGRWTLPLAANGLNGVYFGGILAYLPLYLTQIHGPNAGFFFTADALGVVLLRIPSGILADRTRPAVPMLLGLIMTVIGLAAFIPSTNILWLVLAGAGTGVGAGLFANGVITHLLRLSRNDNRGTSMSLAVATISLGVFLGSSVSGLIIGTHGFGAVIAFGAIAEAIGIPLVLWFDRRPPATVPLPPT